VIIPNVEFRYGIIAEDVDPTKVGRVRVTIDGFTRGSVSPFARVLFPFGQKGPLKKNQLVGCLIYEKVAGVYAILVIGAAYPDPDGKGSQAPAAQDSPEDISSPAAYAHANVVEIDPDNGETWRVKVKGKTTSIVIDGTSNQITLFPEPDTNVVLGRASQDDAKVAIEGDPVEGNTEGGDHVHTVKARIVRGSASMVARKIT
jgi:hypothetical protein